MGTIRGLIMDAFRPNVAAREKWLAVADGTLPQPASSRAAVPHARGNYGFDARGRHDGRDASAWIATRVGARPARLGLFDPMGPQVANDVGSAADVEAFLKPYENDRYIIDPGQRREDDSHRSRPAGQPRLGEEQRGRGHKRDTPSASSCNGDGDDGSSPGDKRDDLWAWRRHRRAGEGPIGDQRLQLSQILSRPGLCHPLKVRTPKPRQSWGFFRPARRAGLFFGEAVP